MNLQIIQDYEQRQAFAKQEAEKYKSLFDTYSMYRLGVFIAFILSVCLAISADEMIVIGLSLPITLIGFVWIMRAQSGFDIKRNYYLDLEKVTTNELDSIKSHSNIYDSGGVFTDDKHHYTADLDIFGQASLYQLSNRAATYPGRNRLAEWFRSPSKREDILTRQQSVKELATKPDWKLETQALLLFANGADAGQLDKLFAYLGTPLQLPGEKWLKPYIKIAPYLLLATIVGGLFFPLVAILATAIAIFNMGVLVSRGSYMAKSGFIADKIGQVLAKYADLFNKIENETWQSAGCKDLVGQIKTRATSQKIKQLASIINKLSYSMIMVVGFILNVFFLWALKQIIAIEDWKRDNKDSFKESFEIIGEFEGLLSLAGLHINYPDWQFPTIADDEGYTYKGKSLAHPLIIQNRVANDFELDDTLKVDIITGSNMAGKSTFLRTVGINAVLGLCGAPVCADSLELSVIRIITYMRIKDSLNESTSTFKAELDRLQMLLKAVETEEKVYFLIDEMLRGTNSVDKYLGSKAVIKQLIAKKGVGQVATHDLQIARLEDEYPDYVRNFYFDIQVVDGEMLFDYRIKHGECTTFNASLLLRSIAIDV